MTYIEQYQQKLMTPREAVQLIPSIGTLSMGMAMSEPTLLLKALEDRIKDPIQNIEELKLYYMHSEKASRSTILKYEYMDVIKPHPFFIRETERDLIEQGERNNKKIIFYMPGNFSNVPNILREIGIDVFLVMVSPMDKSGLFSCGTNSDYTIPTACVAKKLIVEVNPNMPRVGGDSCLHISEINAIVESSEALPEMNYKSPTELDQKITETIIELIPDCATLQIGIGGVPNALCEALQNHQRLGIHTELMSTGLVELIQSGAVTNKYKNINQYKNVYTFAMGSREVYEFLRDNASMEIFPVSYVNNPLVIAKNDNVISINSFLQIDFSGQVNAEAIHGKQYSAPGGQLDFIRGPQLSKGGKSILAAYSTAQNGNVSRIVPCIDGPATDPRADTHYVATEYGVVNLRGKSIPERAALLIEIAHPKFRNELYQQAKELKIL